MAKKAAVLLVLACIGIWQAKSISMSEPAGYYLGWAETDLFERRFRVSFNLIDSSVCSFAVILPKNNGILVAHFDVPLITFSDQPANQ